MRDHALLIRTEFGNMCGAHERHKAKQMIVQNMLFSKSLPQKNIRMYFDYKAEAEPTVWPAQIVAYNW